MMVGRRKIEQFLAAVAVGVVAVAAMGGPATASIAAQPGQDSEFLLPVESAALGVNNRGVVVGWYTAGSDRHAFALSPGRGLVDLGPGTARAVNDDGMVVGEAPGPDGADRATLWPPDGEARDLGLGANSLARDINDRGVAVGYANPGMAGVIHGYVIPPGGRPERLATPAGLPGTSQVPVGIDDRGNVVGDAHDEVTHQSLPAIWRGPRHIASALPASGTNYGVTGVSDGGTVVGARFDPTGGSVSSEAVAWVGGRYREVDLGGPSPTELAWAVNDHGRAVGWDGAPSHATRWHVRTGAAVALPSPGSVYSAATALNNRGAVVGYALTEDGSVRAARFGASRSSSTY